ncbi:MAG TPA: BamA/TamA family outer membrane protein, partial [Ferruginibacter sp.]|nr:BamA/TamA family outer membrane protein [Ferruginibacter sp.]
HIGYYHSQVTYTADTAKKDRPGFLFFKRPKKVAQVTVNYVIEVGPPTIIDTVRYIMRKPDLQKIAEENKAKSLLKVGDPVTKSAVLGEITRLINIYRNKGYYKFSAEELKVRGDTTTAALTTISEDIFEQLKLLEEARKAKDSPKIKLAVVVNQTLDSSRLQQFHLGNVYILPDYKPGDTLNDPTLTTIFARGRMMNGKRCDTCLANFIVKYHQKLFRTGFILRKMAMRRGELYSQDKYYQTISNLTKGGVWQSVTIQVVERQDAPNTIDMVVQLIPGKRYGFEASLEASYSGNSTVNSATAASAGNLLGLSTNVSFLDRNFHKEGIKMTHAVRAGIELNVKPDSSRSQVINSNEFSYTNSFVIPRFIVTINKKMRNSRRYLSQETFFNTNLSYVKRFGLFDMQSAGFSAGIDYAKEPTKAVRPVAQWTWKPFRFEFNRLYNKTHVFDSTLDANPFLKYSFNTALVSDILIPSVRYSFVHINAKHPNRQYSFTGNFDESGLLLGRTGLLKKYLRQFIKADVEYVFSTSRKKSDFVTRVFVGVGIPILGDSTLPFFKQYFGGGSNSMRAWPVRGIGRGSQPLPPFGRSNSFNDRTGDIQLESNLEYRYNIVQLIPNSLILKGALFMDIGNVWNARNSNPTGGFDSAQFKFRNLYKELGVALGTGLRLDFNYFVLRLDLGFRVKRPDIAKNSGWQIPSINIANLFSRGKKIPDPNNPGQTINDERYRKWRYENMNFTIGISYPF